MELRCWLESFQGVYVYVQCAADMRGCGSEGDGAATWTTQETSLSSARHQTETAAGDLHTLAQQGPYA